MKHNHNCLFALIFFLLIVAAGCNNKSGDREAQKLEDQLKQSKLLEIAVDSRLDKEGNLEFVEFYCDQEKWENVLSIGMPSTVTAISIEKDEFSEEDLDRLYEICPNVEALTLNIDGPLVKRGSTTWLHPLEKFKRLNRVEMSSTPMIVSDINALLKIKHITYLQFKYFGDEETDFFKTIAESDHLNGIRYWGKGLTRENVLNIGQNRSLRSLNLFGNGLEPAFYNELANADVIEDLTLTVKNVDTIDFGRYPNLSKLDITRDEIKDINTLIACKKLTNLRFAFRMGSGAPAFPFSNFPDLEELDIWRARLSGGSLKELRNTENLRKFTIWNASGMVQDDIEAIASLSKLESLSLTDTTYRGDIDFTPFKNLKNLRELNFAPDRRCSDDEFDFFTEMQSLRTLVIWNNSSITDVGLAKIGKAKKLEEITFFDCHGFTGEGFKEFALDNCIKEIAMDRCGKLDTTCLAHFHRFKQLETLMLSKVRNSDSSMFLNLTKIRSLKHLNITNVGSGPFGASNVTDDVLDAIEAALPELELLSDAIRK